MSMFGKFSAAGAAVLCVFSAMAGLLQGLESRGDAVYLKPLGAGEERATQDGTSWATAYATPVDAIAAAGAAGRPVYAAEGVYVVNAQIKLEANFEIYGGFPGLSTDETLADRDIDRHQTVFVGDQTLDDVWIHLEPKRGEANYTSTTLTAKVIADGVVNLPAYTGEFDTYIPSRVNNNTAQCLYINAAVGGRIDDFGSSASTAATAAPSGLRVRRFPRPCPAAGSSATSARAGRSMTDWESSRSRTASFSSTPRARAAEVSRRAARRSSGTAFSSPAPVRAVTAAM